MILHTEKTIWYCKSKNYTVEVSMWTEPFKVDSRYHWNIYMHIFPEHPLFNKITKEEEPDYLPLHGGVTYHKWEYDSSGAVVAKRIGCDYQHYDDDRFEKFATRQEARKVFRDADELVEYLENKEQR